MPPRWSWAAPPGSGQEMMTMPGWQEWSPSSALAVEILPAPCLQLGRFSSQAHSSRRDRGGTLNTCCCFGEVLWRVVPAIKNYLQSTLKPRQGQAHTDMTSPPWGHCLPLPMAAATGQPCPGTAKRLRAARAASSHARATPGEWRAPPVLGWTPDVTPGTHLCQTPGVQLMTGEDTQTPTHWDGFWGKEVEKTR